MNESMDTQQEKPPTVNRRLFGCFSLAKFQMGLCYVIMVSMNGLAVAKFERGATDGYAFSYVQPDGHTFGIWGMIYTLLALLCLNADRVFPEARTTICTAFLLNGLWLIMNGLAVEEGWSYWAAVSVLVLCAAFLWMTYSGLAVNYRGSTLMERIVVYAPLSLNLAWVTLAAALDFSNTAMNDKLDFSKKENRTAIGGPDWAMGILVFASLLAGYLAIVKSDVVYCLGTVWALQGVVRQQTQGSGFPHPISARVHDMAHTLSIVLAVCVVVGFTRMFFSRPYSKASRKFRVVRDDPVVDELKARFMPLNDSS
jgi:hypothetical protein